MQPISELSCLSKHSSVIDNNSIHDYRILLDEGIEVADKVRIASLGNSHSMKVAHHLLAIDHRWSVLVEQILSSSVGDWCHKKFGSRFILNNISGLNNDQKENYLHKYHKDFTEFDRGLIAINILILLDDFTIENGATEIIPELETSQNCLASAKSERLVGSAGDVFVWDSRLWHRAGSNIAGTPRRAITMLVTRPFVKPQFDYGSLAFESYSSALKGWLGCDHRVPKTLWEWYQPPETRLYKRG